jgi:hypothetical protein
MDVIIGSHYSRHIQGATMTSEGPTSEQLELVRKLSRLDSTGALEALLADYERLKAEYTLTVKRVPNEMCTKCQKVTASRVLHHASGTEFRCVLCDSQVDFMHNEEDE